MNMSLPHNGSYIIATIFELEHGLSSFARRRSATESAASSRASEPLRPESDHGVPVHLRIVSPDGRSLFETIDRHGTSQPYILLFIKLRPSLLSFDRTPALPGLLSLSMLYFLDTATPPLVPSFAHLGLVEHDSRGLLRSSQPLTSVHNVRMESFWGAHNQIPSPPMLIPRVYVEDEGYESDSSLPALQDID